MKKSRKRRLYRPLLVASLLIGGAFHLAAPVLADGTAAGTTISNTGTATYQDPNNPGTTLNSTSNTVTITVAEVAGITITAAGVTNSSGTTVQVGNILYYDYTITNVGNDPTTFRIPNLATVTGPGTVAGIQYNGSGSDITGSEFTTPSIQPNASVTVRVRVTVTAGATAGSVIAVKLGQTPSDAQNQLRSPDGGDVYTVDDVTAPVRTPVAEVAGVPTNGTREASLTQQTTVAATPQAFATVLETLSGYTSGSPTVFTDDLLTYGLSLRVEPSAPAGSTGFVPADLVGTTVPGIGTNRVLVSEAIPTNTAVITSGANAPVAPTGWQVVYSDTALTTTAEQATWSTTIPTGTITRIGFVYDATTTPIARGTTVSGFRFSLNPTSGFAGGQVATISQLFGQTSGGTSLVYDESGDQSPSNFNDNGTFGSTTPTTGVPNPASDGIDSTNNNTGTGPGGESNVFAISGASAVLAGPSGQPAAVGPNSNNDDFTNKSALVPANTAPGSTIDPGAVGFTNTIQNNGTAPATISLVPTAPATPTDLPNGTTVTITYGAASATYQYSNGTFTLGSGALIQISLGVGASANYGTEVDLPAATALSTDIERGFPVPVTAFVDGTGPVAGTPDGTEPQNITIDRVYTGFLRLVKESRVLQGTGPAVLNADGTFSNTAKTPSPGNIIEYRITYTNISTTAGTSGNVVLNANNVVITEDGIAGTNNWALDRDPSGSPGAGIIDTSNVVGSAVDSGAATITFFSGNPSTTTAADQTGLTAATDVTRYVNTVTATVTPGQSRTFQFQRRLN